jgi:hypothetical protein
MTRLIRDPVGTPRAQILGPIPRTPFNAAFFWVDDFEPTCIVAASSSPGERPSHTVSARLDQNRMTIRRAAVAQSRNCVEFNEMLPQSISGLRLYGCDVFRNTLRTT